MISETDILAAYRLLLSENIIEALKWQPTQWVPEDWEGGSGDRIYSEADIIGMLRIHAAFLNTLVDRHGELTLYRGLYLPPHAIPAPGSVADIGRFCTYSGDADLTSAEASSGVRFNYFVVVKAKANQVRGGEVLARHFNGGWSTEKEIVVSGPVLILAVKPMRGWKSTVPVINFYDWLRKVFG